MLFHLHKIILGGDSVTICDLAQMLFLNSVSAKARVTGNGINGEVNFYQLDDRVLVTAEVEGLPKKSFDCECGVFGFHIHEGESCTGTAEDPFADTKGHYNPDKCPHPCHAGDMPPLFGNDGSAWMAFITDRFEVRNIIGKTVVIHSMPDDFTTQPAGNSGKKIACGVIEQ